MTVSAQKIAELIAVTEKKSLVLIHGWGGSPSVWQNVVPYFQQYYQVHNILLPGLSAQTPSWKNLDDYVLAVASQIPKNSIVVGWSLGGMIATRIAVQHPEKIQRLITLACNATFVERKDWPYAMGEKTFSEFFHGFEQYPDKTLARFIALQSMGDAQRKLVSSKLKKFLPEQIDYREWLRALAILRDMDNRDLIDDIGIPTLMVFGSHDTLVPCDVAEHINKNKNITAQVIKNCGHAIHISNEEQFISLVQEWLAKNDEVKEVALRSKQSVADSFSRAAKTYDQVASLQRYVADQLLLLKDDIHGVVADVGCGTGYCCEKLVNNVNQLYGVDLSKGMLDVAKSKHIYPIHWVVGDSEALPFNDHTLDGVVSSLCFQWSENLSQLFSEQARVLKHGGWLLFSTLGPKTLYELRKSWQSVNEAVHVNKFDPLASVERAALSAGFSIVASQQKETVVYYDDALTLMRELKELGARNVNAGKARGLTTRKVIKEVELNYEQFRNKNGLLPVTYDVFYYLLRKGND